jgi:alpha-beta hydrolase superfamily lysophospholipase
LGGTIALDYALHYPTSLQGLVAAAPALRQVSVPRAKLAIGWLFSRFIPRFSLKLGFKQSVCSSDSILCNAFLEDPLRHEYGSARLATEFFNTVDWIQTHAGDLQVPLLTLHGGADQVAFPEASRAFFQQVTFPDKEYLEYPDYYHDLYIDLGYQTVLTDFGNWLNRHLEGSACQSIGLWVWGTENHA